MTFKRLESGLKTWHRLRGIFTVYKSADMSQSFMKKIINQNLCRDFNMTQTRESTPFVTIEGSVAGPLEVVEKEDYASHPLVVGPQYQSKDIRLSWAVHMQKNVSGVCVMGINSGITTKQILSSRLVSTYQLSGKLGQATDTQFIDGKVVEKSSYGHVTKGRLYQALMSVQSGHQRAAVNLLGLDLQSQAAYEILSTEGLVRPGEKAGTLIYSLKCLSLKPPDFTIEVMCINGTGNYLCMLVHELGLMLKSTATCTQMRCIRHGHWTLQHALVRKHWTAEHIINNIALSKPLMKYIVPKSSGLYKLETGTIHDELSLVNDKSM